MGASINNATLCFVQGIAHPLHAEPSELLC